MSRIVGNKIERVPKLSNPKLLDIPIAEMQDALADNLLWLDHVFGRANTQYERKGETVLGFPAIPMVGKRKEYLNLLPSEGLGSYCFFTTSSTESVDFLMHRPSDISADFSIVFWLNLEEVLAEEDIDIEEIKSEVLTVLTTKTKLRTGRFSLESIQMDADDIFADYDFDEIETHFRTNPFGAFRIEGRLTYANICTTETPQVILYIDGGDSTTTEYELYLDGGDSVSIPTMIIDGNI